MAKRKDETGKTYGEWQVLTYLGLGKYLCECSCGVIKPVQANHLRSGASRNCGHNRVLKVIKSITTHSQSQTKLYKVWNSMKQRCCNSNLKSYKNYGGRGITVCNEWLYFENFYNWAIQNGYKENVGLSIERIDNNGNYCPSNCKWANRYEQACNKRALNTSGVKGISWNTKRKCWVVQIWKDGKSYYVGQFQDLKIAQERLQDKRNEINLN